MKRKILKFDNGHLKESDEEFRPKQEDKHTYQKTLRTIAVLSGLGFQIALPLVISVLAGTYLDSKFQSSPIYTLALLGVGFFVSVSTLVMVVRRVDKLM